MEKHLTICAYCHDTIYGVGHKKFGETFCNERCLKRWILYWRYEDTAKWLRERKQ